MKLESVFKNSNIILLVMFMLLLSCNNINNENNKIIIVIYDGINDSLLIQEPDLNEVKSDFNFYVDDFVRNIKQGDSINFLHTNKPILDTSINDIKINISFDTSIHYVGIGFITKDTTIIQYGVVNKDNLDEILNQLKKYR